MQLEKPHDHGWVNFLRMYLMDRCSYSNGKWIDVTFCHHCKEVPWNNSPVESRNVSPTVILMFLEAYKTIPITFLFLTKIYYHINQ